MLRSLLLLSFLLSVVAGANPAEAERIKRSFELSSEKWLLEMRLATTPEAREELAAKRPDSLAASAEIWRNISADLDKDWTLPYAAFFLNTTRNLGTPEGGPAYMQERQRILKAFSDTHLQSPKVEPMILALIDGDEPQALSLLEKIAKEHPDKTTQGVAALGAALTLRKLGDEPELMAKRLTYLRDAIIKSADHNIGETSIADIASDELYVIRYLTKGRTAPELSGMDMGGRPVRLSDFKGNHVVLLFWDAKTDDTDRVIQLTNQLVTKFRDKPVRILGVTPESTARIRTLQAEGAIMWNNLSDADGKLSAEYHITQRPVVFVIDAGGKIQYSGLPGSFVELTVDALLSPDKEKE